MIQFSADGWIISHPLRERLEGSLFDCDMAWRGGDIGLRGRFRLLRNEQGELEVGGKVA